MKHICFISIVLFSIISQKGLNAQNCSSANITLSTQAEVDDFQATYGPCNSVTGQLIIGSVVDDIIDLSALSSLDNTGSILINTNSNLTSLSGLENITVANNGNVIIANNANLTDISQLSNIGPNVPQLYISNNPVLSNLSIVQNVNSVGRLRLNGMGALTNLNDYSNITSIGTEYNIADNNNLSDISGLSGFAFGQSASTKIFTLTNNPQVSDCSAICPIVGIRLPEIANITTTVQNNLGDCIDEAAINANCGRTACNQATINLSGQVDVLSFQSTYGPCDSVTTSLIIEGNPGNQTISLDALSALEYTGSLVINDNPDLTSLQGLGGLSQSSMNVLSLSNNFSLGDVSQLSGIGTDVNTLAFVNNTILKDLDGIQNIQNLQRLTVQLMGSLINLDDFSSIVDITTQISIINNDRLNNISGLSGITYGSGNNLIFVLNQNTQLLDCSPLCPIFSNFSNLTFQIKDISNNLGPCLDEAAIQNVCCTHPDFTALAALYNSTDGDNWTSNTGWLQDCDPCGVSSGTSWQGIECAGGINRVTGINLTNNNLIGTIPPEIGNFPNLINLILNDNQLSEIPDEIGNLPLIESVSLQECQLSGRVPSSICNLTNLQTLNLSFNNLEGPLPECLPSLTNLNNFLVVHNSLTGPLPEFGSGQTNLSFLLLDNNNFSGTLPISYGDLTAIGLIDISNNDITGYWPQSYNNLCSMISLFNSDNNNYDGSTDFISDQGWNDFCASIIGSSSCGDSYTNIVDSNFEQALIDQGIDSEGTLDGCVLNSDIESIQDLDLSGSQISDLRGIEGFKALVNLIVNDNTLPATTNLASNLNLKYVKGSY